MVRKSGAKPIKQLPSRKFHERYPIAAGVTAVQDFNLDANLWNPDQDADGASTECTGYTLADLATDLFKQPFSPDWSYAMALWLEGVQPNENGADPHVAMQAAVLLGFLRASDAPFTAKSMGELYCANWKNWLSNLDQLSIAFAQNGTVDALGNGDPLSSMIAAASVGQIGISVCTQWYPEWGNLPATAILSMPAQLSNPDYPWHNYVLKGQKTVNGQTYGVLKSWQGANYGENGFAYIGQDVAKAVLEQAGTGAITFDPQYIRFLAMAKILVEHFYPILLPYLPALQSVNQGV